MAKATKFFVPDGKPTDNEPFRKDAPSDEVFDNAFHNEHDLREMYTRENTERRRMGGHTLRRAFTTAQDKLFIAQALKIRDAYETYNNDDVALVFVQQQIAAGKEAEFDAKLAELAKKTVIPKRTGAAPPH